MTTQINMETDGVCNCPEPDAEPGDTMCKLCKGLYNTQSDSTRLQKSLKPKAKRKKN
jgi:hypothetical protein